jgi:hypothetical protein
VLGWRRVHISKAPIEMNTSFENRYCRMSVDNIRSHEAVKRKREVLNGIALSGGCV